MNSFAADTAVERVQPGSYRGVLASGWDIGGNANGGYVLASERLHDNRNG